MSTKESNKESNKKSTKKPSQKTSKNYHHGDLKASLIEAANKLLVEKGADALSLRAIASEVGVTHMAPYAHFKNKKELLQAVAAFGFNELALQMQKQTQGLSKAKDLILHYGVCYVEFAIANPQLYRLMLGQVETSGRRRKPGDEGIDESIKVSIAQPIISQELESGSNKPFILLRDAFAMINQDKRHVMAQAVGAWSMVHGMAALLIEGHFTIPESMTVKDFLSMAAIQSPR